MKKYSSVAQLLLNCEADGLTYPYGNSLIKLNTQGEEIIVVSDFHICSGLTEDKTYQGTENFFADGSFTRFIDHIQHRSNDKKILVINGDFLDFLRNTIVPQKEKDFILWMRELLAIGITKTLDELKASIVKKEITYGLKTDDYKSVWKFITMVEGHIDVFRALGKWLHDGNKLIVVKGNHDLEFYWLAVRNYLRLTLARENHNIESADLMDVMQNKILQNLFFVDDKIVLDEVFYIEHGHRYDKYSYVIDDPVLDNGTELNIPFGSFFNRYLMNRVELAYPFIDNVRPSSNILPILLRERFFLGLKLLFVHVPFMLRIIPKGYYEYMFKKVLTQMLALLIPAVAVTYLLIHNLAAIGSSSNSSWILQEIWTAGKYLSGLFGSYLLSRIVAHYQLTEPDMLDNPARRIMRENKKYKIVTMGHTHNPDQFQMDNRWYYNTGAWIPIVETDSSAIREDKTYTFLHFRRSPSGQPLPTVLERWDDDAGATRDLIIVEPK